MGPTAFIMYCWVKLVGFILWNFILVGEKSEQVGVSLF